MATVQEIHNEFYSAEDRLLAEAVDLIANPQVAKANKAERYSKLGFGSCKPVQDAIDMATKQLKSAELKQTILYFRQYYPANKFITEDEVRRICAKYGLLLGDAEKYTGDIPEKNLVEIERFKLRSEDFVEKERSFGFGLFNTLAWESRGTEYFTGIIPSLGRQTSKPDRTIWDGLLNTYAMGVDPFRSEKKEKEKPPFKICAPKEDFNTAGYVVLDGYKLIYDPVVLQPVKGGYLIVSAWGEEASDELVVNQKLN